MVAEPHLYTQPSEELETENLDLKWTTVAVREIAERDYRLEASVYTGEGNQARKNLEQCKWNIVHLGDMFISEAFYLGRFRRVYVEEKDGVPFILPSQITEICPKASKFIAPKQISEFENTRVQQGQVLLTRSGTIGNVSYVSKTLHNQSLSDDVIRINAQEYSGYIYAYLRSRTGRLMIETNNYGAVVEHIEPGHLNNIPIPNPATILKQEIHNLVEESFRLRDESNELMDEAQALLQETLRLPAIEERQTKAEQFEKTAGVQNYSVLLGKLSNRLDGSYHAPIVRVIEQHLEKMAKEVAQVCDCRISQSVILPGRFKRVYVKEGNGVIFFGGRQIYELDPSNKKYLSTKHHEDKIKNELTLRQNMTAITCSGTIGKVTIVPRHWDGWTANQHIIRVVPADAEIAGYLYAWLSSDYAYPLINQYTHGAVVDEINADQISKIVVPLLRDEDTQRGINSKVLEANRKRTEAYELEQEALRVLDEKVIYAR